MDAIEAHYGRPGLIERVKEDVRESGLDPDALDQTDLSKMDQFHVGGADATDRLARLAELQATDRVLDLGSGIGGPSRYLAANFGCHVTGLDLTDEYCRVASRLATATGLADRVSYQKGDATRTPFEDAGFDVVWTQHASMNIENKPGLYREIFRVLKPGGRLAVHDILSGEGEVRYPVPWASRPELSFLTSEKEMRRALEDMGFRNVVLQDVTPEGIEALKRMMSTAASPGFGVRTLIGPEFPAMLANLVDNFQRGACCLIQAIYIK
jgi:ubiquinone/menaquinone biosynthesis C-methylase UbiE